MRQPTGSLRTSSAKILRRIAQLMRCFSECLYSRSTFTLCPGEMDILPAPESFNAASSLQDGLCKTLQ